MDTLENVFFAMAVALGVAVVVVGWCVAMHLSGPDDELPEDSVFNVPHDALTGEPPFAALRNAHYNPDTKMYETVDGRQFTTEFVHRVCK
jgi:hypothetical protein